MSALHFRRDGRMSRRHNDANVLAMGARMIEQDLAFKIVDKWLGRQILKAEKHPACRHKHA